MDHATALWEAVVLLPITVMLAILYVLVQIVHVTMFLLRQLAVLILAEQRVKHAKHVVFTQCIV